MCTDLACMVMHILKCLHLSIQGIIIQPLPSHKAIFGLNAALAHNDGHISRLFVDCISYI